VWFKKYANMNGELEHVCTELEETVRKLIGKAKENQGRLSRI